MNPTKWIPDIDRLTSSFRQQFGELSVEQLNWKPNESTWSIAQNIDHIMVINQTYLVKIAELQAGNYRLPFTGRFKFLVDFMGKLILKSVQPDRRRKTKTFPIWEPAKSQIKDDIFDRFDKAQADLKESIINSQNLLANGGLISSPANKNIVYKLETAFDIIIAHEQRHLEQAKTLLPMVHRSIGEGDSN
ncbi:MAG: DinB family protein [Fulvivirga sp.]